MTARFTRRVLLALIAAFGLLAATSCQPLIDPSAPPSSTPPDHPLTTLFRASVSGDRLNAGRAWLGVGDSVRAVEAWAGVPSLDSVEMPLLDVIAEEALNAGNPALARSSYQTIASRNPDDRAAQFSLGLLLAATGADAAIEALQVASGESAFSTPAQDILNAMGAQSGERVGWALFAGHFWPAAELAFTRAAADPSFTARGMAGLALSRDYQSKDGGLWMDRALSAAPEDAGVRALESVHLRMQRDLNGSLNAAQRAAALAPESAAMLAQLGAAYERLGQLDGARTWYERAQTLAGGDPRYEDLAATAAQTEDAALDALLEALQRGEASAP
ncbi:MAG: tetratricopeptide repeat protein [Anaerolineae bacterium]